MPGDLYNAALQQMSIATPALVLPSPASRRIATGTQLVELEHP
jgi:hypothetical protein